MNTKLKWIAAVSVFAAGGFYAHNLSTVQGRIPGDLRDAVADSAIGALKAEGGEQGVKIPEPEIKPFNVETGSRMGLSNKGYVAGNDPSAGAPAKPVEWVAIPAGKFIMGTDSGEKGFEDAKPIHEVAIKTFDMSKTDVTVEQYMECVIKGACTEPFIHNGCNWGVAGRQFHPVNCVTWNQASAYAKFRGARLPSEAEFEYAATSGGKNQKYPWGNNEPTSELAVMNTKGTMPVCSKPKGNTAQGLCDMSGNVWQWVQDKYQDSYRGVPADGSAFKGADSDSDRVLRGGCCFDSDARNLRADSRFSHDPGTRTYTFGFRLARSSR